MAQQFGMSGQQMQQSRGAGLQHVTVDDVIQTDVITAEPDTPLPDVAQMMEAEDVGSVVLVEEDRPMGIVTDRTIALSLREMETPAEQTAADVSSEDIITGTTSMTVSDVLDLLSENTIRRLPIVDDNQELEGIVTLDDLLVLLESEMKKATEVIESQSKRQ